MRADLPGASRRDPRAVVLAHLAAFNAHDSERLLAGFSADATWITGADTLRTSAALASLFDASLWELRPSLKLRSMVVDGAAVATELHEEITVDGARRTFAIAAFFDVADGLITRGKVYREGSADIE